ncbi:SH3 domain-containing protein, partial [Coprinopsis sp. MPI-PUGE-AT-0042]
FCKAKFPHTAFVPDGLSFDEGDVIEVLTQHPCGWWDAWSNGKRGWIPSNYV